jgi:hypothetical protein
MVACLKAITRAFNDGSNPPKYALISWYYHACLFMAAPRASGLEGLKDEAEELVKKIDSKWVKVWMMGALRLAGVPYLRGQLTQEKPWDPVGRDWTRLLQQKLRSISGILEKFIVCMSASGETMLTNDYDSSLINVESKEIWSSSLSSCC